ncbi:DUF7089 family protein [Halococcus saccharolyticus]|uniref:Uncharacterized protein n=1 Tax=Halococcus saccharolyticus DSM 5350 TaxID=1227455 RepID=M0MAD9_9EURY|nr:hypothetical protein [Halococcus saccharolyticus]EMA42757.1 hypothetical protein C449_16483 [Halococcus saccharolyticus DSM 5350]
MFEPRELTDELASVRDEHVPGALVLDCERDFETLDPTVAESLGPLVDGLDPRSYPDEWLPSDAPAALERYAGDAFTVGMPGDGGVAWTTQTRPPTVLVKPRLQGSPDAFVDFLLADALVETGLSLPEHFLGFFESSYPDLAAATLLGPADTYQLAAALYDAYCGLHTRETFTTWRDSHPELHDAWVDAGERLEPRLADLSNEVATGDTSFAAAAELACSGVKHDLDLPTPFGALDTKAYREYGAEYAVKWTTKTFEKLDG